MGLPPYLLIWAAMDDQFPAPDGSAHSFTAGITDFIEQSLDGAHQRSALLSSWTGHDLGKDAEAEKERKILDAS